jgi:hypothetical protein
MDEGDSGFRTVNLSDLLAKRLSAENSPLFPKQSDDGISLDAINKLLGKTKVVQKDDGSVDIIPSGSLEDSQKDIDALTSFCQDNGIIIGPIGKKTAKEQLTYLKGRLGEVDFNSMSAEDARNLLLTKGKMTPDQLRLMSDESLIYHANQLK